MCGRYSLSRPTAALASLFDAREAPGLCDRYTPSFNIAPTREVVGLAAPRRGERVLDLYRWGLVPSWVRDPTVGSHPFNARAEGLATTHSFRDAFKTRRLALLADGFFEWREAECGRRRQPVFFQRADGAPLALAGVWESWRDPNPDRGGQLLTCSMITTVAGPDVAGVHDRMPVILEPEALEIWLDPATGNTDDLEALLRPALASVLGHHYVDPRVGDVRNDGSDLVAPVAPESQVPVLGAEPLRLFG